MKIITTVLALSMFFGSPLAAETISVDPSDFALISSVIDDAAYDIRYYSSNNFTESTLSRFLP